MADKLYHQAKDRGRSHLADIWAARADEHNAEMKVIRDSVRRMEAITAREELRNIANA